MQKIFLYDSKHRRKLEFHPIKKDRVKIYVCGPTVYDDAHLGHARSSICFDLLNRLFRVLKYEVTFVKNFTDIDDKIIKKAKEADVDIKTISDKYTANYIKDMNSLKVVPPDITPTATGTLSGISDFIGRLLENNCAYKTANNDVFLSIDSDKDYGTLSHVDLEGEEISRVIYDEDFKKNSRDFALWKSASDDEVGFDSPFGRGRPGWHIECSAMIEEHLAYSEGEYCIDIHAGGADLLFPHHENEAAQTRCATGKNIAKYWMHNGFVTINGEKMSKSLGNSFFIKDILEKYDGEIVRFYLLSTHYRVPLAFGEENLLSSKRRLDKLYRLKKRLNLGEIALDFTLDFSTIKNFFDDLLAGLSDDLNISKALAVLDSFINAANDSLDKGENKDYLLHFKLIFATLGIGDKDPKAYFSLGIDEEEKALIEAKIKEREALKFEKKYKEADEIRDFLRSINVEIKDSKTGTTWEKLN